VNAQNLDFIVIGKTEVFYLTLTSHIAELVAIRQSFAESPAVTLKAHILRCEGFPAGTMTLLSWCLLIKSENCVTT